MSTSLIEETSTYNPKKLDDAVLGDDWRIVNAWYSSIKRGKKIKHSEAIIVSLGVDIMKELLRRDKVTFNPKDLKETSREFSNKVLEKIVKQKVIVEPPFGDLIFEGKAKGLVFPEDLPLSSVYLLVQDGVALGYIRFGALPSKDNDSSHGSQFGKFNYKLVGDMFKKTQKIHRVSDEEREQRWPKNKVLWLYPVRDFFPLEKPVRLSRSLDLKLPKDLKPEDVNPGYLKQVNDMTLVKIHGWLHAGFHEAQKNKKAIERWVNAHAFVVDEMIDRKMEHRPWSDLDEFSKKYQIHKFEKAEDYFQDFLIRKPYAMAAGGLFVSGEGNDLDLVIRDIENQFFEEAVLHFIKKSNVGKTDLVFSVLTSSFTNHIPVYHYGLTRNPRSEIFLQKIKLWELDLQLPSFVNPSPRVYYKRDGATLCFFVREDMSKERDGVIEFKIKQLLPMYYDTRFSYGLYIPTGYKPIYWDVYLREPEPEMITMSISQGLYEIRRLAKTIKPMRYFNSMKPAKASKPGQPATFQSYLSVFKEKDYPIYLQKKYDGVNLEILRSGNRVKIFTEDGEDVTDRLPGAVEEIRKLNHNKFSALAESEFWKGKFHFPRERMAGYLHSKDTPDDSNIVLNFYDVVYTGSHGDLTKRKEEERLKVLDTFNFKQSTIGVPDLKYRLNKAPTEIANTPAELKLKSNKLRFAAGSEGIVAKPHWGIYDLSGRRTEQVKYHNAVQFTAKVLKRNTTKTSGVWTYSWAVKTGNLKSRPKHKVMISGEEFTHGGNTDSTTEKFETGDAITIEAETFNYNYFEEPNEIRVSAWVPRVMESREVKTIDSVRDIITKAKKNHVLCVKVIHTDGSDSYIPQETFKLQSIHALIERLSSIEEFQGVLSLVEYPWALREGTEEVLQRFSRDIPIPEAVREKEKKWNSLTRDQIKDKKPSSFPFGFFEIQHHFRGKSVHGDLRIKANKHLDGWTISNAWKGQIKEPVENLTQAAEVSRDLSKWKFNPDMPPTKHVFASTKAPHPLEWLTQVDNIHEEGEVGATRFFEGVFYGVDWGLSYFGSGGKGSHGTSKPWFFEYFLRGKKFNKKVIFRLLEAPKGKDRKVPAGVFWQAWVAKDQYPYILTRAARMKRNWLPLKGRSALPPEVEALIPSELRYWEKDLSKEAKFNMIDRVYNHLIDEGWIAARKLEVKEPKKLSLEGKTVDFILQYEWWKGPEVIRGVRQNKFYVKLRDGSNVQAISFREKKPDITVEDAGINAMIHKVKSGPLKGSGPTDWMDFEGIIGPEEPGHPAEIKKLPLHVQIIDKGKAQVIEDSDTFKSLQFKGKSLKGYYILKREGPESKFWVWEKSKLPTEAGPIKKEKSKTIA